MEEAYGDCEGLTSVSLGVGLKEIQWRAFQRCTSLERVVIPTAVKAMDDSAFEMCSNLTNLVFLKAHIVAMVVENRRNAICWNSRTGRVLPPSIRT